MLGLAAERTSFGDWRGALWCATNAGRVPVEEEGGFGFIAQRKCAEEASVILQEHRAGWLSALLAARRDSCEEGGFYRFLELAELAKGGGVFEAKGIAATITSDPEDNGEAEAVLSLLAGFPPEIQVKVIVEELPRLEDDGAKDRSDSLIATESKFRSQLLAQAWRESTPRERAALESVLARLSKEAVEDNEPDFAGGVLKLVENQR